ncbi:hypothetical protein [Rhodopila sp.]|uniref:hypothetical protein n=1 Tax=Rhodopila sp. TaxID=2480087 RepID=UPI003D152C03
MSTPLAQGSTGLALVMCFALLVTSQLGAAALLLAVQSVAVAVAAAVLQRPLLGLPPLILGASIWLLRHKTPMLEPRAAALGGAKLAIAAAAILAILCQSQGSLGLPLTVVLLSVLLAATRSHPLMQVIALVALQNGIVLAGCLVAEPPMLSASLLLPTACLMLPLPLAAGLLVPAIASSPRYEPLVRGKSWMPNLPLDARWLGWIDLALAAALFVATLIVPLDSLASVFAPLLGLDGVLRVCAQRNRKTRSPMRRATAWAQTACGIIAVCAPDLMVVWLAVLAAVAAALLPTLSRRWRDAVLAFTAAGLVLFGILLPATPPVAAPSLLGAFSLFGGLAMVAAVVPHLAVVLVVLMLRLANQAAWPPEVQAIAAGIALLALLACAIRLINPVRLHRVALLQLAQASIAALSISIGHAEGRFAALVLLVLLILSRSATRFNGRPAVSLAIAGLGGIPPLGVFPGLVLVVLTISAQDPWLLLGVGAALVPIVLASTPRPWPELSPRPMLPSLVWLPLLLAVFAGYFAPDGLVHWWRILTAGRT